MKLLKKNLLWFPVLVLLPYALLLLLIFYNGDTFNFMGNFAFIILLACFFTAAKGSQWLFGYNRRHIKIKADNLRLPLFVYFSLLLGIVITSWIMGVGMLLTWLVN